jgi:hypothetical protein
MKLDLTHVEFYGSGLNQDGQYTCAVKIFVNDRPHWASAYRFNQDRIHIGGFTSPVADSSPILIPVEAVLFRNGKWFFRRANVENDRDDLPVESTPVAYSPATFSIILRKSKYRSA